jgi:peptidoglycan/xylan/chitin deacetylase (PgdA/CDA1 family)
MRNKIAPLITMILLSFLNFSCKTINHSRTELNIRQFNVYFSFDDGPNAKGDTTARLLDVLKKYQIKAMFCLIGENAEQYPELVRRIYDEGHFIASHGYSDKWASKMKPEEFRDNLVRGGAAISAALGHEMNPKLYRPHGGFYNTAKEKIIHDEGYMIVLSNIRVYDAVVDGKKQNKIVKKVIRKVEKQGGGIVLLHDARDSHFLTETQLAKDPHGVFDRSWIPDALDKIIPALLDKGFVLNNQDFLTVIGN